MITENTLLNGKVQLRQPKTGFRAGIDAVFLAASVRQKTCKNARILELGCGVGAAMLCLAYRLGDMSFDITGVEIEESYAEISIENIKINSLHNKVNVLNKDMRRCDFKGFTHLIMNPPYMEVDAAVLAEDTRKKAANAEIHGTLSDWVKVAYQALQHKGWLHMIHRADALPRILKTLEGKFGAIEVLPLFSKEGDVANRMIVVARKNLKTPFKIYPGLVVHDQNDDYTAEAEAVLRHGAAL